MRPGRTPGPSYQGSPPHDNPSAGPLGEPGLGRVAAQERALGLAAYERLFLAAGELIPSLKGQLMEGERPLLVTADGTMAPAAVALALHDHWRLAHPEAGPAYWLTRSWGMLSWQSIYLAMVAVYRVGTVPALDKLGLGYSAGLVSGFSLPLDPLIGGQQELLIEAAGRRLRRHWQELFEMLASEMRLRPGFVRPLLADDLLAALVRVPDFFGEISPEVVAAHAPLWLAACGLPAEHLAGWCQASAEVASASPGYVRQRCCLHYKRRDGSLCENCPRRQDAAARCDDETGQGLE